MMNKLLNLLIFISVSSSALLGEEKGIRDDSIFFRKSHLVEKIVYGSAYFKNGLESEFRQKLLTRNLFELFLLDEDSLVKIIKRLRINKFMLADIKDPLEWNNLINNKHNLQVRERFLMIGNARLVDEVAINFKEWEKKDLVSKYSEKIDKFNQIFE